MNQFNLTHIRINITNVECIVSHAKTNALHSNRGRLYEHLRENKSIKWILTWLRKTSGYANGRTSTVRDVAQCNFIIRFYIYFLCFQVTGQTRRASDDEQYAVLYQLQCHSEL